MDYSETHDYGSGELPKRCVKCGSTESDGIDKPCKDAAVTPEMVGNQFGYLCPECKRGDSLSVAATVWVGLVPNGTDADNSDHEWEDTSGANCSACNWDGKVSDLKHAENFEGE